MPGSKEYKLAWARKRRASDPLYKARMNAYQSTWKKANRDKLRAGDQRRAAEWRKANPEQARAKARKYAKCHPGVKRAQVAKREAAKRHRTPVWADTAKIRAVYVVAARLTRNTGIPHEVDHELPLQGRTVSGLHVHQNLRVVHRHVNRTKSNRHG